MIKHVVPVNEDLHMRPLQKIANTCIKHKAQINLLYGTKKANAKSLMEMLDVVGSQSTLKQKTIVFEIDGIDSTDVVESLSKLRLDD